jgi:hypothetical protein
MCLHELIVLQITIRKVVHFNPRYTLHIQHT